MSLAKYRRDVLTDVVQEELKIILQKICVGKKHKHLRTRLPTLWTNSYFISTVGGAPLTVIKQYVENQKFV